MNKPTIRSSNLDRFLTCPGSRTLDLKRMEDLLDLSDGGDEMTWRGNWCHWKAAVTLVRNHGAIAPEGGLPPPVLPKGWKPTIWDERSAQWFVDRVVEDTPPDYAIFVEHRMAYTFERFVLIGGLDVFTVNPERTEFTIEDQKSGPAEVDAADENWQLAGYAVLLKTAQPSLQRGTLRIRQKSAEEQTTAVEIEDTDLAGLPMYLEHKINQALDDRYLLQTGYRACRLCDNIECCRALHEEIDAMRLLLTKEEIARLKTTPSLQELADIAARGRAIAGPITRLLDSLKERIAAEGPVTLPDGTMVRIVEEEGRRNVSQPYLGYLFAKEKFTELTGDDGKGHDLAWKTMSMSLTDLEDALAELGVQRKSVDPEKETVEGWVKNQLGHLITRNPVRKLKFT